MQTYDDTNKTTADESINIEGFSSSQYTAQPSRRQRGRWKFKSHKRKLERWGEGIN